LGKLLKKKDCTSEKVEKNEWWNNNRQVRNRA